ncbi:MAG: complex I subunit 5 family protein [Proteobacteria bacterium]|nr:complex I subunit 5 family protein [Pseudomonadota bacterium]MBU1710950.1 complex I subunit 5 family protein [Pseudomonadota bacterium]
MTDYFSTNAIQAFLLSLAPGLPLVTACAFLVPSIRSLAYRLFPWAALPALLVALFGSTTVAIEIPWFFMGGRIGLDDLGKTFLLFTSFLWLVSGLFGREYLADDTKRFRFQIFYLLAMSGNFGLILAQDMLSFYLFFTLMSFAAYVLIIHDGSDKARRAGRIYLWLVVVGEVILFTGMIILAQTSSSMAFSKIDKDLSGIILLALLFLGFGIKAGALPLHFWLPVAHPAAPSPASAVLSGTMIKAGLLGWLRFLPVGSTNLTEGGIFFLIAGLLAAFYGITAGFFRNNPKTVLAYSSISQMGLMTVIVGSGMILPQIWPKAVTAASLYAFHHCLAKGSLFLATGVAKNGWNRGIPAWLFRAGLILPSLALAGMPFTSGAIAKSALKSITTNLPEPWHEVCSILLPLAAVGTMALLVHFLRLTWQPSRQDNRHGQGLRRAWMFNLAGVAVTLWLWPGSETAARHSLTPGTVIHGLWTVAAGCLLAFALTRLIRQRPTAQESHPGVDSFPQKIFKKLFLHCFPDRSARGQHGDLSKYKVDGRNTRFQVIEVQLGKIEKIFGRWTISGLFFLMISILIILSLRS